MECILYSYFRSSASFRVRMAMNLKGIAYEYRAVHLLNNGGEQKSADYLRLNPSAQVPTLVHGDKVLGQSLAIIDYLERIHPEPALFPREAHPRAQVWQFCEMINSGVQPLHNLGVLHDFDKFFGASEAKRGEWIVSVIGKSIPMLETFLKSHSGKYCFGDNVGAADCVLIPHLANVDRYKLSLAEAPTLRRIKENCWQLDAVKRAAPGAQPDCPPELRT